MNIRIRNTRPIKPSLEGRKSRDSQSTQEADSPSFAQSLQSVAKTAIEPTMSRQGATDDKGQGDQKAKSWGKMALEELERIRLDILTGGIPRSRLQHLQHIVHDIPKHIEDHELNTIVAEIQLRIEVELAKYA